MTRNLYQRLTTELSSLTGFGVAFRPIAPCDAGPLFEATRNPGFNEYLLWPAPECRTEMASRVRRIVSASQAGDLTALSVVDECTGQWLSLFRFCPWYEDERHPEIGVWTHPCAWVGGKSVRITRLALDCAFAMSEVQEIYGAAAAQNTASLRLMQLAGMTETDDSAVRPGEGARVFESKNYRVTRQEWSQNRTKVLFEQWLRGDAPIPGISDRPDALARQTIERLLADKPAIRSAETAGHPDVDAQALAYSRSAAALDVVLRAGTGSLDDSSIVEEQPIATPAQPSEPRVRPAA